LFNYQTTIPPDDIHQANQFHAHPYHHLFTCPDYDNQWVMLSYYFIGKQKRSGGKSLMDTDKLYINANRCNS
jgi:hypothetical protein